MSREKKLKPFGEIPESFRELRNKGIFYTDKTAFITYLIEQDRNICVFTRPRRFGKTLMLRTLEAFFEYRLDDDGNPIDNRRDFEGLKVMDAGEDVLKEMGQYPVISISLKGMRNDSFALMLGKLRIELANACDAHQYLLTSPKLLEEDRAKFRQFIAKSEEQDDLEEALSNLCKWIFKATGRKTVILIDEYDVPLQQAAIHDIHNPGDKLFDKTVSLVGNFISSGFKSNSYLAYGIIAGCMRVAKESIFTGMNNPGVITVLDDIPEEFWGFSEDEVKKMLAYYELSDWYPRIEQWYDGYEYSGRKVFNPWSLLNAIRGLVNGLGENAFQPYWGLTSGNDIIDDMIERNPQHREALAKLMTGATMTVPVVDNLSYRDLRKNPDAIWSFLLYTGYLKAIKVTKDEDNMRIAEVAIPNTEVYTIIRNSLQNWWKTIKLRGCDAHTILRALLLGDVSTANRELRILLSDSTSAFDYNEVFYHGMLMGLLGNVATVRSNDEYGEGRPDIVAVAEDVGIILEVKCVTPKALEAEKKNHSEMEEDDIVDWLCDMKLAEAQKQIIEKKYARGVLRHEPAARSVKAYAVCFCKKWCVMREVAVE